MIKQREMMLGHYLEDVSNIKRIHQYPSLCCGHQVWDTDWSDCKDDNGKFNRYVDWGPFQDLVETLEEIGLFDNKIVLVYEDGLHIGFYDGVVKIGTSLSRYVSPYSVSKEEIMKRYNDRFSK